MYTTPHLNAHINTTHIALLTALSQKMVFLYLVARKELVKIGHGIGSHGPGSRCKIHVSRVQHRHRVTVALHDREGEKYR